jgi:hypothetical protein
VTGKQWSKVSGRLLAVSLVLLAVGIGPMLPIWAVVACLIASVTVNVLGLFIFVASEAITAQERRQ